MALLGVCDWFSGLCLFSALRSGRVLLLLFFSVRYCCFVVCELSVRGLHDVLWFLGCFVVSVLLLCGVGKVCCGW